VSYPPFLFHPSQYYRLLTKKRRVSEGPDNKNKVLDYGLQYEASTVYFQHSENCRKQPQPISTNMYKRTTDIRRELNRGALCTILQCLLDESGTLPEEKGLCPVWTLTRKVERGGFPDSTSAKGVLEEEANPASANQRCAAFFATLHPDSYWDDYSTGDYTCQGCEECRGVPAPGKSRNQEGVMKQPVSLSRAANMGNARPPKEPRWISSKKKPKLKKGEAWNQIFGFASSESWECELPRSTCAAGRRILKLTCPYHEAAGCPSRRLAARND